jgi:hypothetical protein
MNTEKFNFSIIIFAKVWTTLNFALNIVQIAQMTGVL